MDPIRPIGPPERDIDPVYRVERAHDEPEEREPQQRRPRPKPRPPAPADTAPEGPVEGDDGHLHIDVQA
jgi:hypothetical protein